MAPEGGSLQRGVRAAGGIGVRLDLSLDVDCMLSGLNFLLHQLPRRRSSASPSLARSLASQALRLCSQARPLHGGDAREHDSPRHARRLPRRRKPRDSASPPEAGPSRSLGAYRAAVEGGYAAVAHPPKERTLRAPAPARAAPARAAPSPARRDSPSHRGAHRPPPFPLRQDYIYVSVSTETVVLEAKSGAGAHPHPPAGGATRHRRASPRVPAARVAGGRPTFRRLGASSVGGATFWGLVRLLTACETFDEAAGGGAEAPQPRTRVQRPVRPPRQVIRLTEMEGACSTNVDMQVGDIYGKAAASSRGLGLKSEASGSPS